MAQFNFTYDEGTTLQQMIGFEMAGIMWGNHLRDNTTINLHVGVTASSNLPHKVIGGAIPAIQANQSYSSFRNNYQNDRSSSDDYTAANNLQWGTSKNASFATHTLSDGSEWASHAATSTVNLTSANAKALNLTNSHSNTLDGFILMSDLSGYNNVGWSYDYTRSGWVDNGKLDFLSTALHEIGHVLGFVSGVDQPGAIDKYVRSTDWSAADVSQKLSDTAARAQYMTPMDLFRFDDQTAWLGQNSITYGNQGGNVFFSIDGGNSKIADFASGADRGKQGDGHQGSHWKQKDNQPLGIMDPDLRTGERSNISNLDLRMLDVIGWDLDFNGSYSNQNLHWIYQQAEQHLANTLGWSTSSLHYYSSYAADYLTHDRSQDVLNLLQDSQIYDLSWLNNYGGGGYWLNWWNSSGGNGWWQMIEQIFQQQGLFSQLSEEDIQAAVDPLTGQATIASNSLPVGSKVASQLRAVEQPFSLVAQVEIFAASLSSGDANYSEQVVLSLGSAGESHYLQDGLTGLSQDLLQATTALSTVIGIRTL